MQASESAQLRRALDKRIKELNSRTSPPPPGKGWLRAVREALGMSAPQVAARMSVSSVNVWRTEARESRGGVTLAAMQEAAQALGCRFVYAIVPAEHSSFDEMLEAKAIEIARRLSKRTSQTMKLEDQEVSSQEAEAQTLELARRLKDHWQSGYWDAE